MKYVIKPADKLPCLRVRFIVKFTSHNGLKIFKRFIRYKSRGKNPVKPPKLCTGSFWLILNKSYTNNIGISPFAIIVLFDENE